MQDIKCPYCGTQQEINYEKCCSCGKILVYTTMECHQCGERRNPTEQEMSDILKASKI